MGVHRYENLVFENVFLFTYQWGYTSMKIWFFKNIFPFTFKKACKNKSTFM